MKKTYSYLNVLGLTLGLLTSSSYGYATTQENSPPKMVMDHESHKEPSKATIKAEVLAETPAKKGDAQTIIIKLTSLEEGKAILLSDLKEAHTKKIHVLIFDQTLTDYQHVHPEPTKEPGIYQFEWTPKNEGVYKLWVDVVPLKTEKEEYIEAALTTVGKDNKPVDKTLTQNSKADDIWYTLSFETQTLKKGHAVMGSIKIVDAQGHDFKDLEPVMGAYAHIVAIHEDFQTITHVHPMGEEPSKESDRGGPTLSFHLDTKKAGYYKIWLQVQIEGSNVYVPFGVEVE